MMIFPAFILLLFLIPMMVKADGAGIFAFVGAIFFAYAWFSRKSSWLAVTDRRVLSASGVIRKREINIVLSRVEAVSVSTGLGGKCLGYGDILINGTGGTKERLAGFPKPRAISHIIQAGVGGVPSGK